MSVQDDLSIQTQGFVAQWNLKTESFPVLSLDYSWPSIGTLGLLSTIIVGKEDKTKEEQIFIDVLAWYLGRVIQSSWEITGIKSDLLYTHDGVELKLATDASINAKLTLILTVILKDVPSPLPVLNNYQRELPTSFDLLTPIALGIALGDSPLVEGIYPDEQNLLKDKQEDIIKSLSRSTARYYERCFPEEPLGQMAELYLANLIFPALGMNEAWPCMNSTNALLEKLKEMKASNSMIVNFSGNLLTLPSEHLAYTGLAIYAAANKTEPSPRALAHYESRKALLGFVRPAMLKARAMLNNDEDWIQSQSRTSNDTTHFLLETRLGFLPWVVMNESIFGMYAKEPRIQKLLKSISSFDFSGAEGAADTILDNDPSNIEVRLQRINLHLVAGEFQQAELALRLLASEPTAENEPRLYSLWTKLDLRIELYEEAYRHFEMAITLAAGDRALALKIFNELAPEFVLTGNEAFLLPFFDKIRGGDDFSFLLNKFRTLNSIGEIALSQEILSNLADLCPLNADIFYNSFLK